MITRPSKQQKPVIAPTIKHGKHLALFVFEILIMRRSQRPDG